MRKRFFALVACLATIISLLAFVGPAPSIGGPLLFGPMHESFQPNKGKIFVLVIGNDARAGNPDSARADAIHIVGVNTKTMKAGILNFPRDSWVPIAGRGHSKINEALQAGGPEALGRTLENVTGIRLDYWVMTGFQGFIGIIDGLGRVRMNIPTDVYDPTGSGAKIDAGNQLLGPLSALAYVRTRHSFGGGDLDRTTNHGRFLLALLRKLREDVASNPAELLNWISLTRRHARFDMSSQELFRLAVLASQLKAKRVGNVTVPASTGSVGAASVVFISPSASRIYARFKANGSL